MIEIEKPQIECIETPADITYGKYVVCLLYTSMGSGKGTPEYWVAVVKPQRVMFEIAGVPEEIAREALRLSLIHISGKILIQT